MGLEEKGDGSNKALMDEIPQSMMGIDDDMCDYLAHIWMTQSALEPRRVRVEPYVLSTVQTVFPRGPRRPT
jgi:hypothetical protein